MAYSVTTSGTVTIAKDGTASGTISISVYDQSQRPAQLVDSCSISASGNVAPEATNRSVGSGTSNDDDSWGLTVTRNGASATGTAAGTYNGSSLSTGVNVAVDHDGQKKHKGTRSAGG